MIHVIKHDMDHNMDLNYRRKIRPVTHSKKVWIDLFPEPTSLQILAQLS